MHWIDRQLFEGALQDKKYANDDHSSNNTLHECWICIYSCSWPSFIYRPFVMKEFLNVALKHKCCYRESLQVFTGTCLCMDWPTLNSFLRVPLQNQFIVDDVSKIIKEAIESTIGGNAYHHDKVNSWTSCVVETCLAVLTKLQKPYKYIGMYLVVVLSD